MTEELLAILVCPVTRTALRWDEDAQELISEAAGLAYPVRDGIPVMLVEEASLAGRADLVVQLMQFQRLAPGGADMGQTLQ